MVRRTEAYRSVRAVHTNLIGDQYEQYNDTSHQTMCRYTRYDSVRTIPTAGRYTGMNQQGMCGCMQIDNRSIMHVWTGTAWCGCTILIAS